jgi:hypothetical protein
MKPPKAETLSPFGRLAVELDAGFQELDRLGGQIERLELDSDSSLDRAIKLLEHFAQNGQRVAEGVQEFARVLAAARESAERSAQAVQNRSTLIQNRKEERDRMQAKLGQLGLKVREITTAATAISSPQQLGELDGRLGALIEEARIILDDARKENFKSLERDAQSLHGSLQSVRRKLASVLT